ncbi:MAG TPA: S53 family peptidase [Kofleriaceae bacterium]|nr:S53 family peptidase [Kofleriaceae bacterium]
MNSNGTSKLDPRPPVEPYFKLHDRRLKSRASSQGPWRVPDLCAAYSWPTGLAGGGVIAIIELRGGWVQSDMDAFFHGLKQPQPSIVDISVDGTTNAPGGSADGEVALDIQIAAASYHCATGKPATIRVYWTGDIASGVRRAAADGCDVCSISWGADEALWGPEAAQDMEQAALEAVEAGMIVFAASGDNDSSDGGPGPANVDLPASAPHVIGCGGTTRRGATETVWNNDPGSATGEGTGGGFSTVFPMPGWQIGAPHGPGRMVPDLAANADPEIGYFIVLHGQQEVIGGTSAVAPLYAGLFASFGQKLRFVTPTLWSHQTCFHDVTAGDNGMFRAGVGPDPCTGLGAPIGTKLAALMANSATLVAQSLRQLALENTRLRAQIVELTAGRFS